MKTTKSLLLIIAIVLSSLTSTATIHTVRVWQGYFQFLSGDITINLGDTVHWLPLDEPTMYHTITSTEIPDGAVSFDQVWQVPVDTFFQYIPQVAGIYQYVCTPHVNMGMVGSITVLDNSTSISENKNLDVATLVFPNPSSDFIYTNQTDFELPFEIFNIKGQRVLSGNGINRIDVSSLKAGVYFLSIVADKPRTTRFIKE